VSKNVKLESHKIAGARGGTTGTASENFANLDLGPTALEIRFASRTKDGSGDNPIILDEELLP